MVSIAKANLKSSKFYLNLEDLKMNIAIIGVGLMGGSFALALKDNGIAKRIVGVDRSESNCNKALELGIVDEIDTIENLYKRDDIELIVLTIPVNSVPEILIKLLNNVKDNQIVMDMGSTKEQMCELVKCHTSRHRFVATHPMWGTENSGPAAAVKGAFKGRVVVMCEAERSDKAAVMVVENIYRKIGMKIEYMDAEQHDIHTAYVSHISHVTSYALALTVLEKEREESKIFDLSGGGFESTVRLAKSPCTMWTPIFLKNKYNVLDVLREHIHQLQIIRKMIENDDEEGLNEAITRANKVSQILEHRK